MIIEIIWKRVNHRRNRSATEGLWLTTPQLTRNMQRFNICWAAVLVVGICCNSPLQMLHLCYTYLTWPTCNWVARVCKIYKLSLALTQLLEQFAGEMALSVTLCFFGGVTWWDAARVMCDMWCVLQSVVTRCQMWWRTRDICNYIKRHALILPFNPCFMGTIT